MPTMLVKAACFNPAKPETGKALVDALILFADLTSDSLVFREVYGAAWARLEGSGIGKVKALQSLIRQGPLKGLKIGAETAIHAKLWTADVVLVHDGESVTPRHFYDICLAAGLEITEIKNTATKGHYAVSFKALSVPYVLDQLVQVALGAGDDKVTIESVVETSFYTPPVPPPPTTSTTVTRALKRLRQVSSGGSSSRQVSSGGSSSRQVSSGGPSSRQVSSGGTSLRDRIDGPPSSSTFVEEVQYYNDQIAFFNAAIADACKRNSS